MNEEIYGVILQVVLMLALSYPLGRYIAKVYRGQRTPLDRLEPLEKRIYRLCRIDPQEKMTWKQFLGALLTLNFFWFLWGMTLLTLQGWLPLNPDHNLGQSATQAFNTCISFMVNCNLQHYSGESGVTYLTQIMVVMLFQFVTAATGMAAFAAMLKAMKGRTTTNVGNFWVYLTRSVTRILLPLSIVVGIILIFEGTPMTFQGKQTIQTLEGAEQTISQGPVAAIVAIKQLGTNGGGFFGANSAHPLENPTFLTNMVECISILLIPMALIFALGFYLHKRKLAAWIFAAMLSVYVTTTIVSINMERGGNCQITQIGIDQSAGNMEGKEARIGSASSALWAMTSTVTSSGSVNSMHDSMTPVTGLLAMLNMQTNCWFGGVGVGFMNYYIFIILSVFLSGLMVGRTPEFMGKKIETKQMKIAVIIALLHPFVILVATAIASRLASTDGTLAAAWLSNPSHHGLSQMLYEFSSAAANNGSGFEGLGDNTPFWNIATGIVMLVSRYVPIIGQVAIAGLLAQKKFTPEGAGTLKTDTLTFTIMTLIVIIIIAALAFFPVLTLGPIADYLGTAPIC